MIKNRKVTCLGLVIGFSALVLAACTASAPTSPASSATPIPTSSPVPDLLVVADPLQIGDLAPDFTLIDNNGNMVNLAETLQKNEQVVLVFYYQFICGSCMGQLRNIEKDRVVYEEFGAKVLAIAVQTVFGAEATYRATQAQYPLLADSEHVVAANYGVYDLLPEDGGLSTPSVFIIDQDRRLVWSHVASTVHEEGDELLPNFKVGSCNGESRVASATIIENLLEIN